MVHVGALSYGGPPANTTTTTTVLLYNCLTSVVVAAANLLTATAEQDRPQLSSAQHSAGSALVTCRSIYVASCAARAGRNPEEH